jgi:phospholipid/cholesterol/gamma-HCH transport system substrate-binding protein
MSMVGGIQDDINTSIKDIKVTLNALNNYLTDKDLNLNIKSSVDNLSEASRKLNLMMDENRENLKKLIGNSVELSEEAKIFLSKNRDEMGNSLEELNILIEKTNSLVTKANDFADEIKSKKNNVGKLLYDDELYSSLTKSITQLNELTNLILEQLKGDGFKVDADIF